MSRDQNAGRIHNMKLDNRPFEMLGELRYLGTTVTNKNSIQEGIKSRLMSRNGGYHWAQNLLSSSFSIQKFKN